MTKGIRGVKQMLAIADYGGVQQMLTITENGGEVASAKSCFLSLDQYITNKGPFCLKLKLCEAFFQTN